MRRAWIILVLGTLLNLVLTVHAFPKRIPIGGLFDHESLQAHTAFRYFVERNNNSTHASFKLDKYTAIIDIDDCYSLSRSMCYIMFQGIFAFFGMVNVSSLATVESITRTFHMPYITPSLPLSRPSASDPGFMLHMRPRYEQAIIDIMNYYRWQKVFYIYDTEEALLRIQEVLGHLNSMQIKTEVDVTHLADVNNCYHLLRQLDSRMNDGDKYIILDLATERSLVLVLQQIQKVGMNRAAYHYLIGGLVMDELELSDFKHGGVNITGFRLVDPEDDEVKKVQHEWSRLNPTYWKGAGTDKKIKLEAALTMDSMAVLVKALSDILADNPQAFKNTFRRGQVFNNGTKGIQCKQDPPVPWKHGPSIIKALKNVSMNGVTGWLSFDETGHRRNFTLDVLELGLNSNTKKVGVWSSRQGLNITKVQKPPPGHAAGGKAKKNYTVTSIVSPPYLTPKKVKQGEPIPEGNDRYEGYCKDLADEISSLLKIDYTIKLVADGKYGGMTKNGDWNGMVGELTKYEADIAIAPLTISSVRERVIDFSKPFMSLGISIMIKKPEKQKPGVFSFMDPLSSEIWMWIIIAYIGVSFILFVVSRLSPYEWQIEDSVNGPTFTNDFTMLNSLWFSLGAFMQQGCDISPRSMSGRVVGSVWWFFTLIIISSYTANLAAFLTVERMLTPIESADDLAKQTAIQYGTLEAGSTMQFFGTSKIAVYERMWQFMSNTEPSVFVSTTELGVLRVRNSKGKYAFLLESTMNDYHNQRKPCNTMKVGGNLDSKGYGIATPLNSPLREPISLAVLQLRESGTLQKLHKKWWYDKGECGQDGESKGSSQSALTLSNVAGIFYILIGGLGLSMIMSLLEFMYKSRNDSRHKKTMFGSAIRSKARLSIRGGPERENGGYTYTAPSQIISMDAYADGNTHTQV